MKQTFFSLTAIIMLISFQSCHVTKSSGTAPPGKQDIHNSMNSLDWTGVYKGFLPCADCEAIQAVIRLNSDLTYSTETRYMGKSNEATSTKGTFSFDGTGNVIILENVDKDRAPGYYAIGENKLTQFDLKGNRITGNLAEKYILAKQLSPVIEKYWKLKELNGKPLNQTDADTKERYLMLKVFDDRVTGNGGCNTFSGTYRLKENNGIEFSKFVSTRMACPEMEIEDQMFKALSTADHFLEKDGELTILKSDGTPLAKFDAIFVN